MNQKLILEKVIEEVIKLSNNKLNFQEDFERIVSLAIEKNLINELESFSFQAKYITGLLQVIKRRENINDENYSIKMKQELIESYEKLKDLLKILTSNFSPFIQNIFNEKYFQLTQTSLTNLNLLCQDFSYLKFYLNDLKQKKDSN
ncbi:MAG: hypothetical protein N2321_06360 [Melioribacteraceae bacterium]|nr:hypothetical protein [Melioribacteraceae bacterium]